MRMNEIARDATHEFSLLYQSRHGPRAVLSWRPALGLCKFMRDTYSKLTRSVTNLVDGSRYKA